MTQQSLRAWWWAKQGLDGSLIGKTAREALLRAGWSRSVGGANPYMSVFARTGAPRASIDAEAGNLQIQELPSARGCTHVLPAEDFALGLGVAQGSGAETEIVNAKRFLGVTDEELGRLAEATLRALEAGPLDPKQIKDAVGGAARSLGEEGKKRGINSTLPLVLGRLQIEGSIRRVPIEGRLDRQRYRYALWRPNPLAGFGLS
ncbi:MAG: winged helix DNA-binding domain-containing protein, partial [Fimbriimonas ginsengisoli]|nr:winged helix DNA-binding domain-containing protein [Fimbriimonas ginsengisoli]